MYNEDILREDPAFAFAYRISKLTERIDSSKCISTMEQFYHGDPELMDIGDICYKLQLGVKEFCMDELGHEEVRFYDNIDQYLQAMPWAGNSEYGDDIDRYFFFCLINLDIAKENFSIEVAYKNTLHSMKCEQQDGDIVIYHRLRDM